MIVAFYYPYLFSQSLLFSLCNSYLFVDFNSMLHNGLPPTRFATWLPAYFRQDKHFKETKPPRKKFQQTPNGGCYNMAKFFLRIVQVPTAGQIIPENFRQPECFFANEPIKILKMNSSENAKLRTLGFRQSRSTKNITRRLQKQIHSGKNVDKVITRKLCVFLAFMEFRKIFQIAKKGRRVIYLIHDFRRWNSPCYNGLQLDELAANVTEYFPQDIYS